MQVYTCTPLQEAPQRSTRHPLNSSFLAFNLLSTTYITTRCIMQHGHSSSYPSEGRGGSSKRSGETTLLPTGTHGFSGRERNESNGNNPATWDALQETCTLRWKDARYDRDRLIALRIALQPTGSHELFDTELKRRGDELIEMHTFMASTYGPNRVKSTG